MLDIILPRQRQRLGWTVEITAPSDAPQNIKTAIGLFAAAAAANPSALRSALEKKSVFGEGSILISPQRIIVEAEIGDPDNKERDRALHVLDGLFSTGADESIRTDELTGHLLNEAASRATNPDMARTRRVHELLGCLAASMDAQILSASSPIPRGPLPPG